MAVAEDEIRKQVAAGSEDQGITPFRASFDPFNMIMQQLGRLDTKIDQQFMTLNTKIDQQFMTLDAKIDQQFMTLDAKIDVLRKEMEAKTDRLDAKIDSRVDDLHQELHQTTRWIIGTIVAVAGVAVALASWLF